MYNATATFEASNGERSSATTNDFYTNGASGFSNNMLIALAALMCALIFALGLNSLVRCSLRLCSQRYSFDPERVAATKTRALHRIPVVAYKSEVSVAATDCPICLCEFSDGEKVRVLPDCNHGFHVSCIDKWLMIHSTCPLCRKQPFEQPRIVEEVNRNVVGIC